MRLTVCLFKPRIWNHDLAEIVRKLELSGLTLVGLRVVTMNKNNATSLLPADSVTENYYLTEKNPSMLSILENLLSFVCRTCQTWKPMWSTCALAPHWFYASRGRMLWRGCWKCWNKWTHSCQRLLVAWVIHTKAAMVSALPCTLVHIQDHDWYVM